MNKFVQLLLLLALPLALANCGKTEEKKAQEEATSLTEEQNRLAREVTYMFPSPGWSDEQLKDAEAKLNRLESVESQLLAHNGKNGIVVTGSPNTAIIAQKRADIASARTRRAAIMPTAVIQALVARKVAEQMRLVREINGAGQPSASWSTEQLNDLENKMNDLDNVDRALRSMAPAAGMVVNSESGGLLVGNKRAEIAQARAEKVDLMRGQRLQKLKDIQAKFEALEVPGKSASRSAKETFAAGLDQIERSLDEVDATKFGAGADALSAESDQLSETLRRKLSAARAISKDAA